MKKMAFLTITLLAMMAQAQAETATVRSCGELSSRTVGPKCVEGQMCPHWVRKEFYIEANISTPETILEATTPKILAKLSKMEDDTVCASGTSTKSADGKAALEVKSITRVAAIAK